MKIGKKLFFLLLLIFLPPQVFGAGTAETMVRVYNDNETQVVSPRLDVQTTTADDSIEIGAGYAEDIVTSSSCDVRSWASQGRITDTRQEEHVNLGTKFHNGEITTGYVQSDENDYHSKIVSVGTSRDFFDKNTTVSLGFSFGNDHVDSSIDRSFDQLLKTESASLGVTQILSKISLAQLLYEYTVENGYLSSPYRVARLLQPDGSVTGLPENNPNVRNRNSLTLKYNYFIAGLALTTSQSLRVYEDSWGVQSGTVEEQLSRDMSAKWSLSFDTRYYQQGQASFYQDKYSPGTLGEFFTGNKTLASYWTLLLGIRPVYHLNSEWDVYGRAEYYNVHFFNFTDVGVPSDPTDDKLYSISAEIFGLGLMRKF